MDFWDCDCKPMLFSMMDFWDCDCNPILCLMIDLLDLLDCDCKPILFFEDGFLGLRLQVTTVFEE